MIWQRKLNKAIREHRANIDHAYRVECLAPLGPLRDKYSRIIDAEINCIRRLKKLKWKIKL
jgi:hypothetical protein